MKDQVDLNSTIQGGGVPWGSPSAKELLAGDSDSDFFGE